MAASFLTQLRAVLWKNLLIKRRNYVSTFFELVIPALFMFLLLWIKSVCNQVDSPTVAYFCGQTDGLDFYTNSLTDYDVTHDPLSVPLAQCLTPPQGCDTPHYYQQEVPPQWVAALSSTLNVSLPSIFTQYGYTRAGKRFPFYGVTVADESRIYDQLDAIAAFANVSTSILFNPSLPLNRMTSAFYNAKALLVIAPKVAGDASLDAAVDALYDGLLKQLTWPGDHKKVLVKFASQADLEMYVADRTYGEAGRPNIAAAIVLNSVDMSKVQWDYAIRTNFTQNFEEDSISTDRLYPTKARPYNIPPTRFTVNGLIKPVISDFMFGYTYTGFATLQKALDDIIINNASKLGEPIKTTISLGMFPETAYHSDTFQAIIGFVLALFFVVAFLYPVSRFIRALVVEKESKIKETMKIMGLSSTAYSLSWFLTLFTQGAVTVLLMTIVGKYSVFQYSNFALVYLFLLCFVLALVLFCFLVSSLFSKAKTAATLGTVFFFATFFPYYALTGPSTGSSAKAAACLLAPTCLGLGADVISALEGGLVGLQWDSVSTQPGETYFSYNLAITMLLVDAAIYALLTIYLENVLPSEYGTRRPFYFLLTRSFWSNLFGSSSVSSRGLTHRPSAERLLLEGLGDVDGANGVKAGSTMEAVDPELRRQEEEGRCISIRGLRKVFKTTGEDRVAVEGLDLDIYEGQITALLGHNGAGKTTVVSMLTGMIPMTSGDAYMRGKRLSTDLGDIRKSMGICPQHDTLFPELTVEEHLQLYGLLKGVHGSYLKDEVNKMIGEVGLVEKTKIVSRQLSGGMKRKLCLGMALIGDSKIVFLDEVTSGMDPYSRRSTWACLERHKRGRVMLLTTHFMDEADILGDRIAILADGELKCCGSSLFLKSHYGVGYTFVCVKKDQSVPSAPIVSAIRAAVPEAQSGPEAGAELSFRLPFESSPRFPLLFTDLDTRKDTDLQLATYGLGVTTLEEVFMRVGEGRGHHVPAVHARHTSDVKGLLAPVVKSDDGSINGSDSSKDSLRRGTLEPVVAPKGTGSSGCCDVFARHVMALLEKRWTYAKRDRKAQCCQLVIPGILVLLGLALIKLIGNPLVQPDLVLSPHMFNEKIHASAQKNVVPVLARSDAARAVMEQLNVERSGLLATYKDVASAPQQPDQFGSCAVGSSDLHTMSNYLASGGVDRRGEAGSVRYGAFTFSDDTTLTDFKYNILVNASALHGVGVYMNLASNAILKALNPDAHITARNFPLPLTAIENAASQAVQGNSAATFIMIAFAFFPASLAIFLVREAETKVKHQQVISGVSLAAYWVSNLIWDCVSYMPPFLLTLALLYAFSISTYTTGISAGALVTVFVAFGPAAITFTYAWTFMFSSHSTAQNVILFANFLTGLVLAFTSFVLALLDSTREVNAKLKYFFRLFPAFCFGDSLLQLSICVNDMCPKLGAKGVSLVDLGSPLDWDVTLANIVYMVVEAVAYFLFTLAIEYAGTKPWIVQWLQRGRAMLLQNLQSIRKWTRRDDGHDQDAHVDGDVEEGDGEDDDVRAEAERVLGGGGDHDVVRIERLRKVFSTQGGPKVAVKDLSFGIPKGALHGFLGANGAGKTTTLSMLTGEFPPTSGTAFIAGYNIVKEQNKLRRLVGFVPQFSALLDLLTVEEHLVLFARIRGVPEDLIPALIKQKLQEMDLVDFANKAAGSLSGGNQRKTSVAIATVGEPPVLFLDEPSTGMDPVSRRKMWVSLSAIRARGTSVVLTTHSMEEAEALCTSISIMVNGRLVCFGSSQHLKSKYGEGFEVEVKLAMATDAEREACSQRLGVSLQSSATRQQLDGFCQKLGRADRATEVCEKGSAGVLWAILQADKVVPVSSFVEWWTAEDKREGMHTFLVETFGQSVVHLLERSSWYSYRYSLATSSGLTLGQVFQSMEDGKRAVGISEYSVGQTTLDQLFQRFVSRQQGQSE